MVQARLLVSSLFLLLVSPPTEARSFDFKSAGFGTYFRGEYGLAVRGDASYADSGGAGVSFDASRTTNAGGEFGLVWASERTTFRISTEVLLPKHLSDVVGSSSGVKYYDLDSKVTAFIPQADLDFVVGSFVESRVLASIGGGVGVATTTNTYKMTPEGTAAFGGVVDNTETGKGQATTVRASVGYEMMFADRATLVFDLGYRYLRINSLKSSGDVATLSGSYSDGSTLKKNDGSDRSLDLSGAFGGAGFRFYF